jgi:hypothetical protein
MRIRRLLGGGADGAGPDRWTGAGERETGGSLYLRHQNRGPGHGRRRGFCRAAGQLAGCPRPLGPAFRDRQREQRRRLAEGLVDRRQRAAVAEQLDRYLASWDPVVLTFEVGRVYKGTVGDHQEIVIPQPLAGGSCGDYVPSGPGPWLIMAHRPSGSPYRLDPGQYLSGFSSCPGGSRALANGGHPDLGPASAPDPWRHHPARGWRRGPGHRDGWRTGAGQPPGSASNQRRLSPVGDLSRFLVPTGKMGPANRARPLPISPSAAHNKSQAMDVSVASVLLARFLPLLLEHVFV